MFFGDEHLGKAVSVLRDRKGLLQKELAAEIGIGKGTMNQYETGRRGLPEETLEKIADIFTCSTIEIWDMAYAIFRFNYFLEKAKRKGVDIEELITPNEPRSLVNEILALYESRAEKDREIFRHLIEFMERNRQGSFGVLRYVVEPQPRNKPTGPKAVGFKSRRSKP